MHTHAHFGTGPLSKNRPLRHRSLSENRPVWKPSSARPPSVWKPSSARAPAVCWKPSSARPPFLQKTVLCAHCVSRTCMLGMWGPSVSYVDGIVTMDVWRNSARLLLLFGRSVIRIGLLPSSSGNTRCVQICTLALCIKQATTSPIPVNFEPWNISWGHFGGKNHSQLQNPNNYHVMYALLEWWLLIQVLLWVSYRDDSELFV